MTKMRIALFGSAIFTASLILPGEAQAHRIYQLQGNQWAIICDNGTGYSFSGSQTGAGDVAGILCGASTNLTSGGGVTVSTLIPASRHVRRVGQRWQAIGHAGSGPQETAFAGYPPHGYPCLGCAPCPGNPTEFCDTVGSSSVMRIHPGAAAAGWTRNAQGRLVRATEQSQR